MADAAENRRDVAQIVNAAGAGRIVLACEHASRFIPAEFGNLGLDETVASSHVAWDPGADAVAMHMASILDAPLVRSCVSRLVYDCNRPPHAESSVPAVSEIHAIPGNRGVSEAGRLERSVRFYEPFRDLLRATLAARPDAALVTIHTFTPVYFGQPRAVEIGILHDVDSRFADAILAVAHDRVVRRNEPYGPQDGVTHTLREHALEPGLLNVMIEVRNDLVATPDAARAIAVDLCRWIAAALAALDQPIRREHSA